MGPYPRDEAEAMRLLAGGMEPRFVAGAWIAAPPRPPVGLQAGAPDGLTAGPVLRRARARGTVTMFAEGRRLRDSGRITAREDRAPLAGQGRRRAEARRRGRRRGGEEGGERGVVPRWGPPSDPVSGRGWPRSDSRRRWRCWTSKAPARLGNSRSAGRREGEGDGGEGEGR
ncbi:MAG: hypothetical protein ACLT98_15725 [Eggerthellaceae bacterium]